MPLASPLPVPDGAQALPLVCEHCAATARLMLPTDTRSLAAMIAAFESAHAECLIDRKAPLHGP
jgi:hypothetical protein